MFFLIPLVALAVGVVSCADDTTALTEKKKKELEDRNNSKADATTLAPDVVVGNADSVDLPDDVKSGVVAPKPLAQLTPKSTHQMAGSVQTLVGTVDACYALLDNPTAKRYDVLKAGGGTSFALPGYGKRNYGTSIQTKAGHFAFSYQSTKGFAGQDGADQGIVLTDKSGFVLDDCSLYSKEKLTRPSAILERSGQIFVLANNCENTAENGIIKCLKDGALMVYTISPEGVFQPQQRLDLAGLKNASAMGIQLQPGGADKLVIAAAGNYFGQDASQPNDAKVATLNLGTLDGYQTYDGILGVGLNGNAPTTSNGQVIFTGNNSTIAAFDGQSLKPLWTPAAIGAGYFIPGVASSGDSVLAHYLGSQGIGSFVFQPDLQQSQILEQENPGFTPVAFTAFGQGQFCSGTAVSDKESTVTLWQSE